MAIIKLNSRKYFILPVITSLIVFILYSNVISGTLKSSRHYNHEKGFSVMLPDSWHIEKGAGVPVAADISAFSPYENSSDQFAENVNIIVVKDPSAASLKNVADRGIAVLRKQMKDFRLYDRGHLTNANNSASWFIHSYNYQGVTLKAVKYSFLKANYVYIITCTAEHNQFSKYKAIFDDIAKSFRFENQ